MKSINSLLFVFILGFTFISCEKEDPVVIIPAETLKITNLHAPSDVRDHSTGEITQKNDYIYFDFSSGQIVSKSDDWDLGFKGTTIITNGGVNGNGKVSAALVTNTFNEVIEAPADNQFNMDTETSNAIPWGSGKGWYNYTSINHLISPIPGRILVFKTVEGHYAKMEILSYYKNSPVIPDPLVDEADNFTFNYAYQKSGSKNF